MNYAALGKRIREERLKLNLTQEKLAEAVGLSPAYIGQVERGEKSLTLGRLVNLAEHLGVTVDYLLSASVSPDNEKDLEIWRRLMHGRTEKEKTIAVNIVKLLFGYLDENA